MTISLSKTPTYIVKAFIYFVWCEGALHTMVFWILCRNICIAERILSYVRWLRWGLMAHTGFVPTASDDAIEVGTLSSPNYFLFRPSCSSIRMDNSIDDNSMTISMWGVHRTHGEFKEETKITIRDMSDYHATKGKKNYKRIHDTTMSSAEVLRGSIQPLGINTSMNIQRSENTPSVGSNMSSFLQNGQDRVPIDRPLFVNTSMTAQNRIDLYRRLDDPPQDSEPALLFRLP
ncbi:hypothetical protein RB195_025865 [Necator americanus]|uniref:Uncharacterized protein n=2 Tax=Necator americanus TaxID=51031 RepID=A0ABR1EU86_NECAM